MKVKSIFIISILIFLVNGIKAQIEFPIADAEWCYYGYGDSGNDLGFFCFSPSKLVEINEKTYTQIDYTPHPYDNYRTIFYREANRKFFVLPQDSTDEILVYDFNLEVGDTFQTNWGWGLYDSITLTVQNVDTVITLDGVPRKRITLGNNEYYGRWLEGIGSLDWVFLFPAYQSTVSGGYSFTCHAQLNELIISPGQTVECDLLDNTEELGIAVYYEVYPNPIEHILNIRFKDGNTNSLKIVNLSGNVVYQKQIEPYERTLQISKVFESGVYLIQVYRKDGWISINKLLKI